MKKQQPLEAVIGLEIHVQLKTASKMFCACANVLGDAPPNTSVCPICLGHPGTLPVLNREAVQKGIALALAFGSGIASKMRFDRKNYFYPDLPKGYQISQFDRPLAKDGSLTLALEGVMRTFSLERLHLEEDAGKNFHRSDATLVDFNRAGVPLAEIVTKPDFRSPSEARAFLQELRLIARYVGASDADMEKGQLRCDANISLRPVGDETLYPKIEVKNLNSFRSVERALAYESKRQAELWHQGKPPAQQETRGWDEGKGETILQRTKEGSDDYRYFPEPDLPPIDISKKDIELIEKAIPELPQAKRARFILEYELKHSETDVLVADKDVADYFEAVVSELKAWLFDSGQVEEGTHDEIWKRSRRKITKLAVSWLTTELFKHLNAEGKAITESPVTPENMAEFIVLVYEGKVNSSAAQTILDVMYREGKDPSDIAEDRKLFQTSDASGLAEFIKQAITENPDQAEQYRVGKEPVLQFLVGKVMKLSGGRADPAVVAKLLKKELRP
ncbi:MAG: glutaminyl-tRNA synthase (glutamine-hydrolyzing) subunit B [Candidatus Komeilibacteria bacterium RIFCSPLOWO2_01_FULL_52_15]|uniref:Aspartyl/glutamyl-tRNA(Asn/Gln) amidotransferase subunit B n=2 Tax=Candidatus Komeiliibacteriota TaxID=1817908 RepID=A0A1G2BRS9_9BACT|nr:MAG: glutaminyl-tRNA synthase (glutamine-hydrolyzing) subunit B [Candidatus Komeilibacteria bacterium RIFCSPHIGHO2_01_FULL_52_14]OGY91831.1 MAG: glutaminyl-tRNA synthase (glutamine-hydrolyzing) subunit B [Candidatus Komeilibacteria bacterium RIFCSPLOWO2_01_FULL_52_15]